MSDLHRLWQHIFGDQTGYLCLWTGTRLEPDGKIDQQTVAQEFYAYPADAEGAERWLRRQARQPRRDTYICAHLLTERARTKDSAAPILALFADMDTAPPPTTVLQPTALVQSSPNRFQAYWRLTRALPAAEAEALNHRLTRALGADPSGWDLTQLLRPPGLPNRKYPVETTVEIVYIHDDAAYDPDELDRILPPLLTAPAPERPATVETRTSGLDEEAVISAIRASQQGPEFDRLMAGDISAYSSHSSADITLSNILAGWCDDDVDLMDAIFRRSGLMRSKWDERRGQSTYGRNTLLDALAYVTWRYEWHPPRIINLRGSGQTDDDAADEASGDMDGASCEDQLSAVRAEVASLRRQLARAQQTIEDQRQQIVYQREQWAECRATIVAMQDALRNNQLGAERSTAVALTFAVASTPDTYTRPIVDVDTGEITGDEPVPLRDEAGYVRVYLGNPPRQYNAERDGPWKPPPGSLACKAGVTPHVAGRHLHKLADAGVIDLDERGKELWVRVCTPDQTRAPKVSEMLTVIAGAERPDDAPRHGDAERFKSVPTTCPQCGGKHLTLRCDNPTCDYALAITPSDHLGRTKRAPTLTVAGRPIHVQDGRTPSTRAAYSARR
jgi:hypothetical protein